MTDKEKMRMVGSALSDFVQLAMSKGLQVNTPDFQRAVNLYLAPKIKEACGDDKVSTMKLLKKYADEHNLPIDDKFIKYLAEIS